MGLSGLRLCVDSNSLTPLGPIPKQNHTVLFYSNNFTQFCKWLWCDSPHAGDRRGLASWLLFGHAAGPAQHIGRAPLGAGFGREEHGVDDGHGAYGIFQRHRNLAALANRPREQVALDGVLVAGRQLLRYQSAAVQIAAVVNAHARSPTGCGVEGNLRLDPSRAPEEAHALLVHDLRAASEYAVAEGVFQDGRRQHVDAAELRIAGDGGGNAHRLLAEDHTRRFDGVAADIEQRAAAVLADV